MSWIVELAGKAESLLNKLDSEAAEVLNKERRNSSSSNVGNNSQISTSMSQSFHGGSGLTRGTLASSTSIPSNLSTYGGRTTNSPKSKRSHRKDSADSALMQFLNARPQEAANIGTRSLSVEPHSRHSSVSSASSFLALGGQDLAAAASIDVDDSASVGTNDAYVNIDTPSDINISAPESTTSRSSPNSNGSAMISSVESETSLLRREVTSLNQEMSQVLRRAKEAEKDANYAKGQLATLSIQHGSVTKLLDQLQNKESELQELIESKNTELNLLKKQLLDVNTLLKLKQSNVDDMKAEQARLLDGASMSSGLQSQALQLSDDRLKEAQAAIEKEKRAHANTQNQMTARLVELEEEQSRVASSLAKVQSRLEEEKTRGQQLSGQIGALKADLTAARNELADYKTKAGRILQNKEKLITSLKEGHEAGSGEGADEELTRAELEQIRQERDLLREELEQCGERLQRVMTELQESEAMMQEEGKGAAMTIAALENDLANETSAKRELELEGRQLAQELQCVQDELQRHKVTSSTRLQEREAEVERLRRQVAHKQSSSSSVSELEERVRTLTEALIHRQNTMETITTEKHSLMMQMERLQQQYAESEKLLNQDHHTVLFNAEEARNRMPSFMVESPFDRGLTLRVKRVYSSLDKFSVRLGVFLRRYPLARVFIILYMLLLHMWVLLVLLTYTPEVHTDENLGDYRGMPHA